MLALLGWHRTTLADPVSAVPSTTAATEKAPSDQFDWTGDTIILHTDFPGIKRHGDKDKVDYCAPAKSTWLINHEDKATYKLTAMLQLDSSWTTMLNAISPQDKDSPKPKICVNDPTQPLPNKQIAYELDKAEIELVPHSQRGWTFGVLLVPFKYQLSDQSLSSSTTIGPYLGYRIADWAEMTAGTSTTLVGSIGLVNNIPVPTAPGVTPAGSVNRSGLSTAFGVVFSVDKGTGIQVGLLLGQDRLGSNAVAPYAYEGKTWVSVSVGYKFF